MNEAYRRNWYTFERAAEVTGMSARTLRRRLAGVSEQNLHVDTSTGGRPRNLIHFEALPELHAYHRMNAAPAVNQESAASQDYVVNPPPAPRPPPKPRGIALDDLERAKLRLQAVLEYEDRRRLLSATEAALATCRDWAQRPRIVTVRVADERLPSGYRRSTKIDVRIDPFQPGTVRTWAGTYAKSKDIMSLVDRKKTVVGRKAAHIPDAILSYIYGLSTSTARADVAKAVAWGKAHWRGEESWTDVSIDTWRRRLKAFDPRRAGKDLNHSLQRYRANQTPDVSVDWNALPYNGRFEVDDVQQDWFALASDSERLVRPFAYAVLRARTRQWVAFVTSETPITDDQVSELIGFTMAQPSGGIPDEWKLENRNVTAKGDVVEILQALGCRVSRTSMDGGQAVFEGACKDGSEGHPQGHALIERANRRMHDLAWNAPGQVGTDERNTAPSRTETWKRLAAEAAARGEFVVIHGADQWAARIRQVCEQYNNAPHGGLQEIVDPATGEVRHMTPNECARLLAAHEARIMDQKLLPLFATRGVIVPVTRNGIRLGNRTYGRHDEELKKYAKVKAFVSDMAPDVAYIHELGRCVEGYEKEAPGGWDQFGKKRGEESRFKNQYSEIMAQAMESDASITLSAMTTLADPAPSRPHTVVAPDALAARAARMRDALAAHRDRRAALDRRFESPASTQQPDNPATQQLPRSRRGLLSREQDLEDQLAALGSPTTQEVTP